jgi:medium-chain acyl-[acyl-carrier-protein] hydrolase
MGNYLYSENFSIRNSDFSNLDQIKPHSVLEILEEIAGRHAAKLGCGYLDCKKNHQAWVCISTRVEFLDDLINGENGLVETYPSKTGRIDFDRSYEIKRLDGTSCIKAVTKWVVINYDTRRIERSSNVTFPSDCDIAPIIEMPKKIVLDDDIVLNNSIEFNTCLNDLDHNGHVNNCRYLSFVYNTFDESKKIKSFECEYVKELKYGEKATMKFDDKKENYQIYNSSNELSFTLKICWR